MMAVSLFAALTAALAQMPQTKPIRSEDIPRAFALENDPVPRVGRRHHAIRHKNSRLKFKKRKDKKRRK